MIRASALLAVLLHRTHSLNAVELAVLLSWRVILFA
jgi:hypothetical protein